MLAAVMSHSVSLTTHEALSGVFGSISLASWIFLLVSKQLDTTTLLFFISYAFADVQGP